MPACNAPASRRGPRAVTLYLLIDSMPSLTAGGLHAYDGHLRNPDLNARIEKADAAFATVDELRNDLIEAGLEVPRLVVGGTPTFPTHTRREGVECSPGTCLLWDAGYAAKLPDLSFLHAATVVTRVVSKVGENRLCLDLGHKAIAADNPNPRVVLFDLPDARTIVHNEEHLTIESDHASTFQVGDALYGVPVHICPTCALHREAPRRQFVRTRRRPLANRRARSHLGDLKPAPWTQWQQGPMQPFALASLTAPRLEMSER